MIRKYVQASFLDDNGNIKPEEIQADIAPPASLMPPVIQAGPVKEGYNSPPVDKYNVDTYTGEPFDNHIVIKQLRFRNGVSSALRELTDWLESNPQWNLYNAEDPENDGTLIVLVWQPAIPPE